MSLSFYVWIIFADCNRLGIWPLTVAGSPDSSRIATKRAPPGLFETLTFQTGRRRPARPISTAGLVSILWNGIDRADGTRAFISDASPRPNSSSPTLLDGIQRPFRFRKFLTFRFPTIASLIPAAPRPPSILKVTVTPKMPMKTFSKNPNRTHKCQGSESPRRNRRHSHALRPLGSRPRIKLLLADTAKCTSRRRRVDRDFTRTEGLSVVGYSLTLPPLVHLSAHQTG